MAKKDFTLDSGLDVTVFKRRGNRNLRLSIGPDGQVRVSIPSWAPYKTGLDFARSRQDWISSQQKPPTVLRPGQAIGKAHHLEFVPRPDAVKISSRVHSSLVTVSHPDTTHFHSAAVQNEAEKACVKALRAQAEQLLPQRLETLATAHGLSYHAVSVKRLKSRWGSCDQQQNIVLNLFLMQLPWELIDYVLLHELTHTEVLRHGPDFWQAMAARLPEVKRLRKAIRQYRPVLGAGMA